MISRSDSSQHSGKATAGMVLGIISVIAWFIPLFGFPVTIVGIVLSSFGISSHYRGQAIAGLALNIIFLIITAINSFLGMLIGLGS